MEQQLVQEAIFACRLAPLDLIDWVLEDYRTHQIIGGAISIFHPEMGVRGVARKVGL